MKQTRMKRKKEKHRKNKAIVKVHKLGLSIVICMYLFVLLVSFEVSFDVVSAARSATFSTAQSYNPGTYGSSFTNAEQYWPSIYDRERCEATTDFLMIIRPASCSPSVVRSDLLEEQNVPIFCPVDAIKINPLIDIGEIRSVKFRGASRSPYVAGVGFYPNRAAIKYNKGLLNNKFINEIGYVVIILKRIERETDMPDSVKLNLTAVLNYDSSGFFGTGRSSFYLEVVDDKYWGEGDNYRENSFFKGRGYLRAEWVEDEMAGIAIYRDKEEKLKTFNLEKGKQSGIFYMPGFYCKAGVKLRLNDIVAGVKKVRLDVNGEEMWLLEGERFLDNKCRISRIDVKEITVNEEEKWEKTVKIICGGKSKELSYIEGKEQVAEEAEEEEFSGDLKLDYDDEQDNVREWSVNVIDVFEQSLGAADYIGGSYADATSVKGETWAAKALLDIGILAAELGFKNTAQNIFRKIITNYPGTSEEVDSVHELNKLDLPTTSYSSVSIRLMEIKIPSKDEASADFIVYEKEDEEDEFERTGDSFEQIQEGEKFFSDRFKLKRLGIDKVEVEYWKDEKKIKTISLSLDERTKVITEKENGEDESKYKIYLDNIYFERVAKVSVIPKVNFDRSEADFGVEIGIEKRAIQLTPEKIQEKIAGLNKSIEKWEGIVERLGNLVKAMKGVCFATSAILLVKNFFFNLGGGATARQAVMPAWYEHCKEDIDCLDNALIENDIQIYKDKIEPFNKQLTSWTNQYDRNKVKQMLIEEYGLGSMEGIENAGLEQIRDHALRKQILEGDISTILETKLNEENRVFEKILKGLKTGGEASGELMKVSTEEGVDKKAWQKTFNPEITYYTAGRNKELVQTIPVPGEYKDFEGEMRTGFYVVVPDNGYGKNGAVKNFYIRNIGDDSYAAQALVIHRDNPEISRFESGEAKKLFENSLRAIEQANNQYGEKHISILGEAFIVNLKKAGVGGMRCQDFMFAKDCKILFNVCDPVICPSSRCNLGGAYEVDDVIRSGIIGSIALCLPNFVGFGGDVIIPVCLSGIHAGLDSYLSVLVSYRDCLQEQLDTGRTVGICDEIHSIYLCEFFWRQIAPIVEYLIPNIIQRAYGQGGTRGGGEYLTVMAAWTNVQNSINYLKNDYAVNAYAAFKARSSGEIGTEFCKVFVSARYPSSKKFFDTLLEPDSPVQYTAWFDEIPFTEATTPPTSQYKVFYHIYAGKDERVNYQVYLTDPAGTASGYIRDVFMIDAGTIQRGGSVSETRDFTAPAGYRQVCIVINGQDKCGFKRVSTSFALDYMSDKYYEGQAEKQDIRTEKECISGTPSIYAVSPNIQESVSGALSPDLEKRGIVRICSSDNPGLGTNPKRWESVGYCDNSNIKCWLDKESVKEVIKNKDIKSNIVEEGDLSGEVEGREIIDEEALAELGRIKIDVEIMISKIKKIKSKSTMISLIDSIDTEQKIGDIDIKALFDRIEYVKENVGSNQYAAEAVYYKFMIYYVLTERLMELDKKGIETTGADVAPDDEEEAAEPSEPSDSEVSGEEGEEAEIVSVCSKCGEGALGGAFNICDEEECEELSTEDETCYYISKGRECKSCSDVEECEQIDSSYECRIMEDKCGLPCDFVDEECVTFSWELT